MKEFLASITVFGFFFTVLYLLVLVTESFGSEIGTAGLLMFGMIVAVLGKCTCDLLDI